MFDREVIEIMSIIMKTPPSVIRENQAKLLGNTC